MTTSKQILDQARSWMGAKEGTYMHHEIIDTYNAHTPLPRGYKVTYTDSWCATFTSACAIAQGADNIIPIECSCTKLIEIAKTMGIWQENENITPNPGDLILYDWDANQSNPEHVGYVESVSGNKIIVIEGNYDNMVKRRTVTRGNRQIRGYIQPKYDNTVSDSPGESAPVTDIKVNIYYKVRTQKHGWLPEVKNLEDYAGWENSPITDVAMKVDQGSIKYRVHVKGQGWLPYVTGYNTNDYNNGYAGNGKVIDAVEAYYYTPDNIRPYKRVKYSVNYYAWQYDNEKSNGQDGYAGLFGTTATSLRMEII